MALSGEKLKVVQDTYAEIEGINEELREIMKNINNVGLSLQSKYKMVASIMNEPYSTTDFVVATDFTSKTLYYCLDPLLDGLGVFFIPSKDGSKLLPIQASVVTDRSQNPTLGVEFNPAMTEPALSAKGLSFTDILIKMDDLVPPIKNGATDILKQLFDNPPEAQGSEKDFFDNYIMEQLFNITKNPEFKNTILKPKVKILKAD